MEVVKNIKYFKLYISQFLFFLCTIKGQSYNDLSIDLDQAYFNLNELNFETNISADSLNNGKLKINSFQFGFDKINFENIKDKSIKMKVYGPELFIDFIEFRSNYILPNYYSLLLSDLSDKRYEYPYDGLEILQKAIETYFLKFDRYPNDYNDLVTESMISSNKYPFKNKNWSYHLFLPDSTVVKTTSQYRFPKKSVNLDWETRKIINKQSDIYSKDEINWSLHWKISNIKQTFISDIDINLSSDKLGLEIYQKKGNFNLENISVALVPNNDLFEQTLLNLIDRWLDDDEITEILASGMVGSKQGWEESPYQQTPCNLKKLNYITPTLKDSRISLKIFSGIFQTNQPDVMRGEETQIAGFLNETPNFNGSICLPGTHSKWVEIRNNNIIKFKTFMTR